VTYGFQTTLTVSWTGTSQCSSETRRPSASNRRIFYYLICKLTGRPITPLDNLRAPDRAGVKMSVLDWIKFIIFAGIPSIPAFIHSRPAVADKRVISVRDHMPHHVISVSLTLFFQSSSTSSTRRRNTRNWELSGGYCPRYTPTKASKNLTKFFLHYQVLLRRIHGCSICRNGVCAHRCHLPSWRVQNKRG